MRDIERAHRDDAHACAPDTRWLVFELRRSRDALQRILARCQDEDETNPLAAEVKFVANQVLELYEPRRKVKKKKKKRKFRKKKCAGRADRDCSSSRPRRLPAGGASTWAAVRRGAGARQPGPLRSGRGAAGARQRWRRPTGARRKRMCRGLGVAALRLTRARGDAAAKPDDRRGRGRIPCRAAALAVVGRDLGVRRRGRREEDGPDRARVPSPSPTARAGRASSSASASSTRTPTDRRRCSRRPASPTPSLCDRELLAAGRRRSRGPGAVARPRERRAAVLRPAPPRIGGIAGGRVWNPPVASAIQNAGGRVHPSLQRDPASGGERRRPGDARFRGGLAERYRGLLAANSGSRHLGGRADIGTRPVGAGAQRHGRPRRASPTGCWRARPTGAVACRAGCDHCCYQSVGVTPPEAMAILSTTCRGLLADAGAGSASPTHVAAHRARTRGLSTAERFSPDHPGAFLEGRDGGRCYDLRPVRPALVAGA